MRSMQDENRINGDGRWQMTDELSHCQCECCSKACECNSCTETVPRLNREIKELKEKLRDIHRVIKMAAMDESIK